MGTLPTYGQANSGIGLGYYIQAGMSKFNSLNYLHKHLVLKWYSSLVGDDNIWDLFFKGLSKGHCLNNIPNHQKKEKKKKGAHMSTRRSMVENFYLLTLTKQCQLKKWRFLLWYCWSKHHRTLVIGRHEIFDPKISNLLSIW